MIRILDKIFILTGLFAICLLDIFGIEESKPNVILILADDMSMGDLSYFNGGKTKTPNLNRLISESVWFNRGYSASPVCGPARASLLTGRYPHRTGVVTLNMIKYPDMTRLKSDETTLADFFRYNGYKTGLIGKWHLGMGKNWHPLVRGFDEFEGFYDHTTTAYFKYVLDVNGRTDEFENIYLTDDLSNRAIDFVNRHKDEPFFLHLAHYAPHRPLEAPPELIKDYLDHGFDKNTATIYAMIEVMDRGIGQLMNTVSTLGLREKTIVIFASDNGPDPLTGERFNFGIRGTKYQVYEGGIHVPMLISWPGTLEPRSEDIIIHFNDVFPTLASMCRLPLSPKLSLDGVDLGGYLLGLSKAINQPKFWQWNRGNPNYTHNAAMRDGDWKLVRPEVTRSDNPPDSTEDIVLYHLGTDPDERVDISSQHVERYESMMLSLKAWSEEVEYDRTR